MGFTVLFDYQGILRPHTQIKGLVPRFLYACIAGAHPLFSFGWPQGLGNRYPNPTLHETPSISAVVPDADAAPCAGYPAHRSGFNNYAIFVLNTKLHLR